MVSVIGVVLRLWTCLSVLRLFLSEVEFVGLVKCLLKELAISLLVVRILLLNFIERLGSVDVGSLLFKDLIVFQYVCWLCLWSQCSFTCCLQSCCLWSAMFLFMSRLSSAICGWLGFVDLRLFLLLICARM